MSLGELLDESLALYRGNAKLYLSVIWIPVVVMAVASALLTILAVNTVPAMTDPNDPNQVFGMLGALAATLMVFFPVYLFCTVYEQAALTIAISGTYLNQGGVTVIAVNQRLKQVIWRVLGGLLLTAVLLGAVGVVIALAMGALIGGAAATKAEAAGLLAIPVMCGGFVFIVVLAILLTFVTQAIVVEDLRPFEALARSIQLVKKQFWRILGTIIVAGILTSILGSILQLAIAIPFTPLVGGMDFTGRAVELSNVQVILSGIRDGLSQAANALVLPFAVGVSVLLYFDTRIRSEGFDVEMLARSMGSGPSGPAEFMV